jgi:hypothetical protein
MTCDNCSDEIKTSTDTYYESVTPVAGGQTTKRYCSVQCINEDVGFSDEEIESLMRQAGYEVPSEYDFEWAGDINSNINNLVLSSGGGGEFLISLDHVEKNCSVSVFHKASEQLYEITLRTYEKGEDGEKLGSQDVKTEQTGVFRRALAYAENYMKDVEDRKV